MEEYTLAAVAQHSKANDCWVVIHNKVYDVTNYLEDHPGGAALLIEVAGKDATEEFVEVGHSIEANDDLKKLYVGDLSEAEHAEAVEVYHPTFDKVSQRAVIGTGQPPWWGRRLLRSLFNAGVTAGLGAAVWGVATGKVDTSLLRKLYRQGAESSGSSGLFWWGFGIATVGEVPASLSLVTWLWSKLDASRSSHTMCPTG